MNPYKLLFAPAIAVAIFGVALPSPAAGSVTAVPTWAAPTPLSSGVGDPLPAPELSDFMQTDAKSFDDYTGRAVLIEFFEYW